MRISAALGTQRAAATVRCQLARTTGSVASHRNPFAASSRTIARAVTDTPRGGYRKIPQTLNPRWRLKSSSVTPEIEVDAEAPSEFCVFMEVRDSELDQYSVVNNAVYNSYLQHARHKFLEHIGLDADEVARSGDALALSNMNLRYHAPLRSRDKFIVTVSVQRVTAARAVLFQEVWKIVADAVESASPTSSLDDLTTQRDDRLRVMSAEATVVWLDGDYRPKRIPKEAVQVMRGFTSSVLLFG